MTTLIMPVRERWDLAYRALDSLLGQVITVNVVVVDDDGGDKPPPTHPMIDMVIKNEANLGLWQSVNRAIRPLRLDEHLCFFGCDVTFTNGWLPPLVAALASLGGLGLVWPRDDHQNHGNASHFMTTKRWLWIVYGEDRFPAGPGGYWHWYLDSELTCRSRDLGRAIYVSESHVPHHVEPSPQGPGAWAGADDKAVQDRRYHEWTQGGLVVSRARLVEALSAS